MSDVQGKSLLIQTIPPEASLRWVWHSDSESWVCGKPNDGAGVFYENGKNPECSQGFYFGCVVAGEITDIASGPYPSQEEAMSAAWKRLAHLTAELRGEIDGRRDEFRSAQQTGSDGHLKGRTHYLPCEGTAAF